MCVRLCACMDIMVGVVVSGRFFHEGCRCEGVCAGMSGEGVCV